MQLPQIRDYCSSASYVVVVAAVAAAAGGNPPVLAIFIVEVSRVCVCVCGTYERLEGEGGSGTEPILGGNLS